MTLSLRRIFLYGTGLAFGLLASQQVFAQSVRSPSALAPILVGPYDGSDVTEKNVVWTWFMQPKANDGSEIICDLKVVEVLGGQTPEEALRNNPLVIIKEDLTTSAWQMNFAARSFIPGHRYAWRIIAKIRKNNAEEVVSQSEIWSYTYNTPEKISDSSVSRIGSPPSSGQTPIPADSASHYQPNLTKTSSPFNISGTSRLTVESAQHWGVVSQAPPNFARLQIDPTITLNDVPLGLNFLLSTEENSDKTEINRGAIGSQNTKKGLNLVLQQRLKNEINAVEHQRDSASIDTLRQFSITDSMTFANKINALYRLEDKDLTENLETLKSFGLASDKQELMAQFPAFGFGKVAPQFSQFLFSNVTINGGMIEYNPGLFYAAGTIGKVQRELNVNGIPSEIIHTDSALLSAVEFFKNIYSGRIGYGRRNGNHIFLSVLHADDDESSRTLQGILNRPIFFDSDSTILRPDGTTGDTVVKKAKSNAIMTNQQVSAAGLEAHLSFEQLDIEGEINLSYLKDADQRLWDAHDDTLGVRSAKGLENLFHPSENELYDFNYAARISYSFLEKTGKLSGGARYVGAGFRSPVVAGLRTDVLRADAHYDQLFLDRQIRFNGSYTYEEAGFKQDKFNLSNLSSFTGGVEFRLSGLPALEVNYAQFDQNLTLNKNQETLRSTQKNTIRQLIANVSFVYLGLGVRMESFATFMLQHGKTTINDIPDLLSPGSFRSNTYMLTHRVALSTLLTLGITGSYTTTFASNKDSSATLAGDLSAIITIIRDAQIIAGANLINEHVSHSQIFGTYIVFRQPVGSFGDFDLRVDYRKLKTGTGLVAPPTDLVTGFNGRLVFSVKW